MAAFLTTAALTLLAVTVASAVYAVFRAVHAAAIVAAALDLDLQRMI